ncbi:hypothetical protein ACFLXQ_00530 [Chloroflexota bacterium]
MTISPQLTNTKSKTYRGAFYKTHRRIYLATLILGILLVAVSCRLSRSGSEEIDSDSQPALGAGFRYSPYGPQYDPGPEYWAGVGRQMAGRFPGATPQTIWIVSVVIGENTYLTFPATGTSKNILTSPTDDNEAALTLFDELGVQVWLQVEPSQAPVEELIHLMLTQYGHHPSVIGVGVDVEWYQSHDKAEGKAVTDAEAEAWLAATRSHGEHYRLMLKHWETGKMPPTVREGILFADDSQGFTSLDEMATEFSIWGEAFAPAPVAFQFGYERDRAWWETLDDPPGEIGHRILAAVPNTEALYWVDFTVLRVFPPDSTDHNGGATK